MKKILFLLFISLICCSSFTAVKGESIMAFGPYQISVNDGYAKIIYCDVSNPEISGDYTVPSEVGGIKVREIGARAFEGASNIQTLVIPEGIETIGEYAFYRCNYFKSLHLPDTLKDIGKGAFESNLSLTSVRFPDGITKLPDNLFKDCGFYEIAIPDTVVEIGASAFRYNRNLSAISLPENIEKIGDRAFYQCGSAIDLSHLSKIKAIGSEAFSYNHIQKIVIPASTTEIAPHAFDGCTGLEEIVFEAGDTPLYLKEPVFCNNFSLCKVVFSERVKEISEKEFWLYKGYLKSSLDPTVYYTYENFRQEYLDMKEKMVIICPPYSAAEAFSAQAGYRYGHNVSVMLSGNELEFDQPPRIQNDRTLVPLRKIFEELGAEVLWDDATKTVTAEKDSVKITLSIGEKTMYKNGEAVLLDAAAVIVNSRTLVPLRAVSEAFGCKVDWDGENRIVWITEQKR